MGSARSEQGTVLVVGDDLGTLETFAVALRHAGYHVETATTVAGGVSSLKARNAQLVLCDLRLPDGEALQVLAQAKSFSQQTSFVVMTGHGTVASAVDAMRLGASDYLPKPLGVDVVIKLAERYARAPNAPLLGDRGANDTFAPRATRIARVLTGPFSAQEDVRSIAELCRVAPVGVAVAGGTFRRMCREERIHARQALRFARLLRALALANEHGASPSEWMDVDPRTFHALITDAGIDIRCTINGMPLQDFIRQQRLVCNVLVLRAVERDCTVLSHK